MIHVNLERELTRAKRIVKVPEKLLHIREYERLGALGDNKLLSKIGVNKAFEKGQKAKQKMERVANNIKPFNGDKVFHIKDIERICKKYYLRFLPAHYYQGTVDAELANKLSTFEVAYNLKIEGLSKNDKEETQDCFILAPASSFKLEERPKDPLFFYHIDGDFFYLVHKWGNDLNAFRGLAGVLNSIWFVLLFILPLWCLLAYIDFKLMAWSWGWEFMGYNILRDGNTPVAVVSAFGCVGLFVAAIWIVCMICYKDERPFGNADWNTKFK